MDELAALAVARQHDLGAGALCACLFANLEFTLFMTWLKVTSRNLP